MADVFDIRCVLKHFVGCTPHYPEKPADEPPQYITRIDLGDGEWVDQCSDCGAVLASHFNPDTEAALGPRS